MTTSMGRNDTMVYKKLGFAYLYYTSLSADTALSYLGWISILHVPLMVRSITM